MSRHAFGEILEDEEGLLEWYEQHQVMMPEDAKGYTLDDWIDYGIVGWDEPMQTYFLHCMENQDGQPIWWLGRSHGEIPTFADLCRLIRAIFADAVDFRFIDRIDRNDCP